MTRRARHFAHYRAEHCVAYETYPHRAVKTAFLQTYQECVTSSRPFVVRVPVEDACTGLAAILGVTCKFARQRDLDPARSFPYATLEQAHGGFVADVLLSSEHAKEVLFVEILVTHACEPARIASGKRILELRIRSDEDIAALRTALIPAGADTPHMVHNFRIKAERGSLCDGQCRRSAAVFVVHQSGRPKFFHNMTPARALEFKPATAAWRKILVEFEEAPVWVGTEQLRYVGTDLPPGDSLARRAAIDAVGHGIKVRSCEVCRRQGSPTFRGVWCFAHREAVHPSRAVQCGEFVSVQFVAELTRLRERNEQSQARRLGRR